MVARVRCPTAIGRSPVHPLPGEDGHEVGDGAGDPLGHRVGDTAAFVDDQADESVVVAGLDVCLGYPFGQA